MKRDTANSTSTSTTTTLALVIQDSYTHTTMRVRAQGALACTLSRGPRGGSAGVADVISPSSSNRGADASLRHRRPSAPPPTCRRSCGSPCQGVLRAGPIFDHWRTNAEAPGKTLAGHATQRRALRGAAPRGASGPAGRRRFRPVASKRAERLSTPARGCVVRGRASSTKRGCGRPCLQERGGGWASWGRIARPGPSVGRSDHKPKSEDNEEQIRSGNKGKRRRARGKEMKGAHPAYHRALS